MTGYYDEILEEIKNLMKEGRTEEAFFTVEKELRMPYIPLEYEEQFNRIRKDLIALKKENEESREASLYTLLKQLRGSDSEQLQAAARLGERNLREIIPEIKAYFSDDPCPEAAAVLIEAIAEQEISEDFTYCRDGVTYEFFGDSVTPCSESGGFLKGLACLEEWVANDNPSMFAMCKTLLIRKVYMFLPLSYEAEEGEDLALNILQEVSELTDEGMTYREVLKNNGMDSLLRERS